MEAQITIPHPETIGYYSNLYGVNYQLALSIAQCESQLNPKAINLTSPARGLYQFFPSTWEYYGLKHWGSLEGKSRFNYGNSADVAVWVMKNYGTHDWDASKYCWSKKLADMSG